MPAQHAVSANYWSLCRDCFDTSRPADDRCAVCGSPRLACHRELSTLSIAHIDCDAFYAAIEKRDDPSLLDKPVIIGGGRRGVVSTACYIARVNGVHSAMPMFKALRACPEATVIKPNMDKYAAVGKEVREMMRTLTPLVEPLSIDEAFLDLTGTERVHNAAPAEVLGRFAMHVEREIGITISIGLAPNKFLAKIASDRDKPRGFSVVGRAEMVSFLAALPVTAIWGVGKAMQVRLARAGYRMISDLQKADERDLAAKFGAMGLRLARLSRGDDTRSVSPDSNRKSVSAETTFNSDIADLEELSKLLRQLSEKVSRRLKKSQICGQTIVLKLKTADFRLKTRNRRITDPTQLADRIYRVGRELLEKECDGTYYRLIGIGVSDLQPDTFSDPDDLIDDDAVKRAAAEQAMDAVRGKFGRDAVNVGLIFDQTPQSGIDSPDIETEDE